MKFISTFKAPALPKMMADLKHANQFLKVFSLISLLSIIAALLVCAMVLHRNLQVVVLGSEGRVVDSKSKIDPRIEVESAIREYISKRYVWTPKSIEQSLANAQAFIPQAMRKKFVEGMTATIRFAKERQINQRVYANEIQIDLQKQAALITGDRMMQIQGLRTATELRVILYFESGPRTTENPWGVYISREEDKGPG